MSLNLSLIFRGPHHFIIESAAEYTQPFTFINPLTSSDIRSLRWYLEVYSSQYTMDVDDDRARTIEKSLPTWGSALFSATLGQPTARDIFRQFLNRKQAQRVVTVGASHPDILSLPWELLHLPQGEFLLNSHPYISVRRKLNICIEPSLQLYQSKETVRILFIISRPIDESFIDPRSDAQAVIDVLTAQIEGRVNIEFLRPATLDALQKRLADCQQPAIDIVHFDGHGMYDTDGRYTNHLGLVGDATPDSGGVGYLLFEDEGSRRLLVSAKKLADCLKKQKVGLVVLSACQSSMVSTADESDEAEEDLPTTDAMGNIAAGLIHSGIPAVLAMSYSVLVITTQKLFHRFYHNVVAGRGIGEALDDARRYLYLNRARGERQRGQKRIEFELQDWFLPTLYQIGADTPLLIPRSTEEPTNGSGDNKHSKSIKDFGNLPKRQRANFFGRSWELWQIERAFVRGTRRVSVVGFEGQGKTLLVQEAGRWLCQTKMFQQMCFIDYTSFKGADAVKLAVGTIGAVLGQSLKNSDAATLALQETTILIILDSLETLSTNSLQEVLNIAYVWSQVNSCRVLLTSRQLDFDHGQYKAYGSREHIQIILSGLGSENYPVDALNYFQSLMQLPPEPTVPIPKRVELVNLFRQLDFHPLSISLLARQLKKLTPADLPLQLAPLLIEASEENDSLAAPLSLLLHSLTPEAQQILLRLGVFQGGAFEDNLLTIIRLGQTEQQDYLVRIIKESQHNETVSASSIGLTSAEWHDLMQLIREKPELLTEAEASVREGATGESLNSIWTMLRQSLISSGLIQVKHILDVSSPFVKFHPALAPTLRMQITDEAFTEIVSCYRRRYYQLAGYLYFEDSKNPSVARAIARRELPNLMKAVNSSLIVEDEEIDSAEFVEKVSCFLRKFGLNQDWLELISNLQPDIEKVGSQGWLISLSKQGESLFEVGNYTKAAEIFITIIDALGDTLIYERCVALNRLGLCLASQGKHEEALVHYQQGISTIAQLEYKDDSRRLKGDLCSNLASTFRFRGDYARAKTAYEIAIEIASQRGDERTVGIIENQCATLALTQGALSEAAARYQKALNVFQQLKEPALQAIALHQLGVVHHDLHQWEDAEAYYREAARISETSGNLAAAARTWNQLACVSQMTGDLTSAIYWYEKAILIGREVGDMRSVALRLHNLAVLLKDQKGVIDSPLYLSSAHKYAEEALEIKRNLDPIATKIWKTYVVLAEIVERQGSDVKAQEYRLKAQQIKATSNTIR